MVVVNNMEYVIAMHTISLIGLLIALLGPPVVSLVSLKLEGHVGTNYGSLI